MKWAVIVLVMLSLLGSMMWVMPSPRQRFQAKLRLEARKLGFTVQLVRLQLPRATGETEGDARNLPAYRLLRDNPNRRQRDAHLSWSAARVESLASDGLPAGWSWIKGENTLPKTSLDRLSGLLLALPAEVVAVESDGFADRVGIRHGDMILSLGDRDIENINDFRRALDDFDPEAAVQFRIRRGGTTFELIVE